MKNIFKTLTIVIVLAAFYLAGCDDGGPGTRNSGAELAETSTIGGVPLGIFGSQDGEEETAAITANVTIPWSQGQSARFVPVFASGSAGASVSAYRDNGTGSGVYAAIAGGGYDFTGGNNTFWLRVISQDSSSTRYYKITVTVAAVQTGATLTSATLGGRDIILGSPNPTIGSVGPGSVEMPLGTNFTNLSFAHVRAAPSSQATVTILVNDGTVPDPAEITRTTFAGLNFSGANKTLWIRVVAENGTSINHYGINVTEAPAQTGNTLANNATLSGVAITLGTPNTNINSVTAGSVTIPYTNRSGQFIFNLDAGSDLATVRYLLNNGAVPSSITTAPITAPVNVTTSAENDTLWIRVTSQSGADNFYRINVTLQYTPSDLQPYLGKRLSLTGPVYQLNFMALVTGGNGQPAYTGGALSTLRSTRGKHEGAINASNVFNIQFPGEPSFTDVPGIHELFGELGGNLYSPNLYASINITSGSSANAYFAEGFYVIGQSIHEKLTLERWSVTISGGTYGAGNAVGNATVEKILFFYVDQNVTVNFVGRSNSDLMAAVGAEFGLTLTSGNIVTSNSNMNLREGWNVVYQRDALNFNENTGVGTATMLINNTAPSNLLWTLLPRD